MLVGKVAIVTGGAGGIGRVIVGALLSEGAQVVSADCDRAALVSLDRAASAAGSAERLRCLPIDLTQRDAEWRVAEHAQKEFGRIDVLLNVAGVNLASYRKNNRWERPKFWEVEPEVWSLFMEVNANLVFRMSRAVAPTMVEAGWGRIVTVTTTFWSMLRGPTPYGPTKAASEALMAAMAGELADTGVTANVLVPGGLTNTIMVPDQPDVPRERLLQPDVMLPPLLWLLSADADGVNGRRIRACDWDPSLAPGAAIRTAGAPVGWPDIADDLWVPES